MMHHNLGLGTIDYIKLIHITITADERSMLIADLSVKRYSSFRCCLSISRRMQPCDIINKFGSAVVSSGIRSAIPNYKHSDILQLQQEDPSKSMTI